MWSHLDLMKERGTREKLEDEGIGPKWRDRLKKETTSFNVCCRGTSQREEASAGNEIRKIFPLFSLEHDRSTRIYP